MEAGESHAFFGLDLFVTNEWSDLHLRTLQGWQVLHFTFESAVHISTYGMSLQWLFIIIFACLLSILPGKFQDYRSQTMSPIAVDQPRNQT
jgi:hypothetical protein